MNKNSCGWASEILHPSIGGLSHCKVSNMGGAGFLPLASSTWMRTRSIPIFGLVIVVTRIWSSHWTGWWSWPMWNIYNLYIEKYSISAQQSCHGLSILTTSLQISSFKLRCFLRAFSGTLREMGSDAYDVVTWRDVDPWKCICWSLGNSKQRLDIPMTDPYVWYIC